MLKISRKIGVLKQSQSALFCSITHMARLLSQALVHFVIDRASLFADHRISGLPIRAKYKHYGTILRAYL